MVRAFQLTSLSHYDFQYLIGKRSLTTSLKFKFLRTWHCNVFDQEFLVKYQEINSIKPKRVFLIHFDVKKSLGMKTI